MSKAMNEANRIINSCAVNPLWHGSLTREEVDAILAICGGEVFCNGHLRKFEFRKITEKSYIFKTVQV